MNELIEHKTWWQNNWKRLVPLMLLIVIITGVLVTSKIGKSTTDIAKAYADVSLYKNAIAIVQKNEEVIKQLDKLALLEGAVKYSKNNKSVELHFRVKGTKGKGKIDIFADKVGNDWHYKTINVRLKEPKQTIKIV